VSDAKVLKLLEELEAALFLRAFCKKKKRGEGVGEELAHKAGHAGD
jgi:hypothetical protein